MTIFQDLWKIFACSIANWNERLVKYCAGENSKKEWRGFHKIGGYEPSGWNYGEGYYSFGGYYSFRSNFQFHVNNFFPSCFVFLTKQEKKFNPVQPSDAFHIETNYFICCENQIIGFCMKCSTWLNWVQLFCWWFISRMLQLSSCKALPCKVLITQVILTWLTGLTGWLYWDFVCFQKLSYMCNYGHVRQKPVFDKIFSIGFSSWTS